MEKTYRSCVVGVFLRYDGKILVAKRSDNGAWQFPQGGIEEGETSVEALYREMEEELGVKNFSVLKKSEKIVKYDFPADLKTAIAKKYKGQEQEWFLCILSEGEEPCLERVKTLEFSQVKWESMSFVLKEIVHWKRNSYEKGLLELGLLEAGEL